MLLSDFPNCANREFKNFTVSYVAVSMLEIIDIRYLFNEEDESAHEDIRYLFNES